MFLGNKVMVLSLVMSVLLMFASGYVSAAAWGKQYFPNIELTSHDGKKLRFFDDLIKDKIVAINFIYTHCPDTCPMETAQLVRVQEILGDQLGRDVFFYSISIDPENDTPSVLAEYRERFGARWTFLTGKKSEIVSLRRKLGLYISEIQDGSNNHNVNMIIGNQATGRWMKRSPFENAHVLADQLSNWLNGWKNAPKGKDYASAPELRSIPRGETLFRTRCSSCHSLSGREPKFALGPDLLGVTERRDTRWLLDWLKAPDQMLAKKDPIAMALYEKYNKLAMPNLRLNKEEAFDLLDYIKSESQRQTHAMHSGSTGVPHEPYTMLAQNAAANTDILAIMNAWVKQADPKAKVNAGYMTLVNMNNEAVTVLNIKSDAFKSVEVHEMAMVDGMHQMRMLKSLTIPAKGQVNLQPGGIHLMMMGPKKYLEKGQHVELELSFDSGRKQKLSLKVN